MKDVCCEDIPDIHRFERKIFQTLSSPLGTTKFERLFEKPCNLQTHRKTLARAGIRSSCNLPQMPRGFVVIKVKEASGKNRSGNVVWDPNFIEGFIRAEMRSEGGQKLVVSPIKIPNQACIVALAFTLL